jgi:hypothetical protein
LVAATEVATGEDIDRLDRELRGVLS